MQNEGRVKIGFKCPVCSCEIQTDVLYLPTKVGVEKHPQTVRSVWCDKCNNKSILDYRIYRKRDGSPKLKVHKLIFDGKECTRRYKIISWSKLEILRKTKEKKNEQK